MWKCPACGDTYAIGIAIGGPTCSRDGSAMQKVLYRNNQVPVEIPNVHIGGEVNVGGNAYNDGTIKIFDDGKMNVNKDLINTGVISINDPEKIKEMLVQMVKTSGTVAELGINILQTFFKVEK